jgi:DNA replication and repair protein RecF
MISNIRLQNFRSYQDASFEFEDGVNVIVGPNASGKTNLLEAILVVAQGKSYRAKDSELLAYQAPWTRLDADIVDKHRVVKLEPQADTVKKSFELDDKSLVRLTISRQIPVVLFEPNQLVLLTASPEQRRNFLDTILEQTSADFAQARRQYLRTLAQRNSLLKSGQPGAHNQMFAWDIRLSELGGKIAHHRQALIEIFNADISATYSSIAGQKHKVELAYISKVATDNYASALLKKLEQDAELDRLRGFTGAGPHRDDIQISIDGRSMQSVASRGEARTLLLALKIKEAHILEDKNQIKPILLLDDVFGELDGKRRQALIEFLKAYQVFITTTDADVIIKNFTNQTNVIAFQLAATEDSR